MRSASNEPPEMFFVMMAALKTGAPSDPCAGARMRGGGTGGVSPWMKKISGHGTVVLPLLGPSVDTRRIPGVLLSPCGEHRPRINGPQRGEPRVGFRSRMQLRSAEFI